MERKQGTDILSGLSVTPCPLCLPIASSVNQCVVGLLEVFKPRILC